MQIKTPCCKLYLQQGAEKQIEQLSVSFIRTIPSVSEFHRIGTNTLRSWTLPPVENFTPPRRQLLIILYADFRICQYLFRVLRYFFVSSSILKLSTHFRIILLKVALSSEFDFMYRIVCSLHFASAVATSHALAMLT